MDDEMMTIEEAAELVRRPVNTLRFWRAQRTGPAAFIVGRRLTYLRSDVEEWLTAQRSAAPIAPTHEADRAGNTDTASADAGTALA
nr:helix-turn-helix domain-containing protein [Allobranchiibius huperziae]